MTTEQQTPQTEPTQPIQKPTVQSSTIQETVINPNRPDFNANAQKAYLSQTEYLNGEQKHAENEEHENEADGEAVESEATEGNEAQNPTEAEQKDQQVEHKDKPNRQERISQYLAQMAKERAKLRQKEKELEARTKNTTGVDINDLKNRAKEDPIAVLEEIGLNYNDITQRIIQGKDNPEKRQLQKALEKLDALEQQIKQQEENKQKEAEKEATAKQLQEFQNQMINHLQASGDTYELVNATKSYDAVYQTIQAYFQHYNRILSFDEAAEVVENELEKQELAKLEALRKTNKAKKWGFFGPQEEQAVKEPVNVSQPMAQGSQPSASEQRSVPQSSQKTITGDMVATTPMKKKRRMTREESLAEAAKLLRFNQ